MKALGSSVHRGNNLQPFDLHGDISVNKQKPEAHPEDEPVRKLQGLRRLSFFIL
jgi:hypothetical protein